MNIRYQWLQANPDPMSIAVIIVDDIMWGMLYVYPTHFPNVDGNAIELCPTGQLHNAHINRAIPEGAEGLDFIDVWVKAQDITRTIKTFAQLTTAPF